ncbi:MAG: PstS family phosphate ABC transporter substrate-binding protein [Actinomycetota bacterium]
MSRRLPPRRIVSFGALAALMFVGACGGSGGTGDSGSDLTGQILIDGSSTVAPLMTLVAEDYQSENSGVRVTVGTSGTGGGFEKFCAGEVDIANASREIKETEIEACQKAGIEFIEVIVANDALSVVVNKNNTWAECLTVDQLKKMWEPGAQGKVTRWNQVDPSFPDTPIGLYGAGTDSGTFDYFTKAINGEEGSSRTDYNPSEDDNVTVKGVEGDEGALGYFGFSYLEENLERVKAVKIDGGKGCVEPSVAAVQDGTYTPLARPLYAYVSKAAGARPEVKAFFQYFDEVRDELTTEALFVPLDDAQKQQESAKVAEIVAL